MGEQPDPKTVQILYIGASDPAQEKLWEQLGREGLTVEFVRGRKAGLEWTARLQPFVVVINTDENHAAADRLSRAVSHLAPNTRRLLLSDWRPAPGFPCECHLIRPAPLHKLRDALLRLLDRSEVRLLRAGPLELDMASGYVSGPVGEHHLTPKERDLLAAFLRRPNEVVTRAELMRLVWETAYMGDTRTLDVHIRWVREKIETDARHPSLLVTRRGRGYLLAVGGGTGTPSSQPAAGSETSPV